MSAPFPGPSRPSRFRLRRTSRYPTTSYGGSNGARPAADSPGSSLTRRGVLGGIIVVAVGGAADVVRMLSRGSDAQTLANAPGLAPRVVGLLTGNLGPGSTPSAHPSQSSSATPSATHSHAPSHHHGPPHSQAPTPHSHGPVHQTKAELQRERRARQHVTLPPARLPVRSSPAYQLNQLIPNPPQQAIALTIDDGPDPDYTPDVLRLLDKYAMQASFCVIGVHADAYPRLVRDISRAGHILVNHSYTHVLPFSRLPEERLVHEITWTQRSIERAAGVTPQLFRAPGGDWSRFILRACASYGLEPLDWDLDPRDWARPGAKKIARRMNRAKPGEIVLCHDGGGDRIETVRALRKVLPSWQRRGLLTVPLQLPTN